MSERPILFSGAMVRALLAGRKTQTRRVVKLDPAPAALHLPTWPSIHGVALNPDLSRPSVQREWAQRCPYGAPGDRLWVRETWDFRRTQGREITLAYGADGAQRDARAPVGWDPVIYGTERWRPSIHMPRWASRITLKVTGVRVERLQDISEEDAKAEGAAHRIAPGGDLSAVFDALPGEKEAPIGYRAHFRDLWESINGADSWADNPWVWVVSFKRVKT